MEGILYMGFTRKIIVDNILQELTGGKPFIFVIMPFNERWHIYEEVKKIIENEFGLSCIRADDVSASGYDLLEKIHFLIERAELIVAEISTPNPNVFYEVGYASGNRKNIVLLSEDSSNIPADIRGRELIVYDTSKRGVIAFKEEFFKNAKTIIGSRISLLREMLLADPPLPSYIVASPKYPGEDSRIRGQVYDTRTFGDNLGVVGLLSAFGTILGERAKVELISAQYCDPDILKKDYNLYVIGSKKINPLCGQLLELMSKGKNPHFYLGHKSEEKEIGDYIVRLYCTENGKTEHLKGKAERRGPDRGIIHTTDYGIIVRGPHPKHKNRITLILAGAHSLGTGGACIAATRSTFIQQIRELLPERSILSEHGKTIWALVEANSSDDGLLNERGVKILRAGVW
jgi:hypothetical protein